MGCCWAVAWNRAPVFHDSEIPGWNLCKSRVGNKWGKVLELFAGLFIIVIVIINGYFVVAGIFYIVVLLFFSAKDSFNPGRL